MTETTIDVAGLDELYAQLQELPANIEKNCLRGALRAGQKPILAIARDMVPTAEPSEQAKRYGAHAGSLKASLKISTRVRNGTVTATLKAGSKVAYYARMVEFGTAAHVITAKPGHALAIGGGMYRSVEHPGAKKQPFMRPALDRGAAAALEAFAAYMTDRIEREQAKLSGPDNDIPDGS